MASSPQPSSIAATNSYHVDLPVPEPCCISPCDPPWLSDKQCFIWYETRYLRIPIYSKPQAAVLTAVAAVALRTYLEFRIVYAHRLCLVGKQHGPLLYTVTLLPGEKVTLYHSDRYRQITSVQDRYSVQTTFMQFLSVVHQARVTDTLNALSDRLTNARGSASVSVGGGLGSLFGAPSGDTSTSFATTDHTVVQAGHVSDQFNQSIMQSSQLTHAERSEVISTYTEKDEVNVSVRTIQNENACRAVTYFVRKVVELYRFGTVVANISYRIVSPNVAPDWHSLNDASGVPSALQSQFKVAFGLLPKIGEAIDAPGVISLPTDGTVYDPELAHCDSCEPERAAAQAIQLERQKADALKACREAELLELELERRRKLLEQGTLAPFEAAPAPEPAPA